MKSFELLILFFRRSTMKNAVIREKNRENQPCRERSSHARRQHQTESDLVLLGRGDPDKYGIWKRWPHYNYTWSELHLKLFPWQFQMYNSDFSNTWGKCSPDIWRWWWNQLLYPQTRPSVSRSPWIINILRIETKVGGKDHSREPWICKSVCSDRSKIGKNKMVVVHLLAIVGFENVTKIQLWKLIHPQSKQ